MGLSRDRFRFKLGDDAYLAELRIKGDVWHYTVWRDGAEVAHSAFKPRTAELYEPRSLAIPTPMGEATLTIGFVGWWSTACVVEQGGKTLWRSHEKDIALPRRVHAFLQWLDGMDTEKSPETIERDARVKALRPSIAVDIAMAVAFFFVAREFGLVIAAVAGAGATFALIVLQRFVKVDLLGGFVVFGAIMALISAGLALAFQDDTFVKLRGSIMGVIGAGAFLVDGVYGGKYLGKRMALYMSGLFRLDPRRASWAAAGAAVAVIAIDLPLVFLLTTDQWIWYNAFLDGLVALPVVLTAMWLARERRPASN